MGQNLYLDVRISGYKGEPVRIFSQYDLNNNTIMVSNILPYRPASNQHLTDKQMQARQALQKDTLLIVDNRLAFEDYDLLFDEKEHLDGAADAFFEYEKQGMIIIPDELKGRTNVQSVLEIRKLELSRGTVWELNASRVQNTHMAILALCYAAKKATIGSNMGRLLKESNRTSNHSMMPFML